MRDKFDVYITINMKRKIVSLLLCVTTIALSLAAQDAKNQDKTIQTKMDAFTSRTGAIIKFVDYNLPSLKLYLGGSADTRIGKLTSAGESRFFYQIEKTGQYSNSTASIEYSDLLEIIKALSTLKTSVDNDLALHPDYLENKFVTSDGFQIGYYISNEKTKWYLKLEKYGSDNTVFINDVETLVNAFQGAKDKIEEIKSK